MSPAYESLGILTLLSLVMYVRSSYTNTSFNKPENIHTPFLPPKAMKKVPGNNGEKEGRIFYFSDKESEISVELGFTIPFITIPIKQKYEGSKKPLVDINVGALTAGTILTTAALIFIPKAFSGLEPQISFGKSESNEKSGFLSRMDRALMDHNIDPAICTQKLICWLVQSAASKVTTGEGSSMDKIIDGISSNFLLEKLAQGTSVLEAINNARKDESCSSIYYRCPVTQEALQRIAHNFMKGII